MVKESSAICNRCDEYHRTRRQERDREAIVAVLLHLEKP
jgi:hypothetical protein